VDSDNEPEIIKLASEDAVRAIGHSADVLATYKKDDNARVEQKNWTDVQKLLGWERYDPRSCGGDKRSLRTRAAAVEKTGRNRWKLKTDFHFPATTTNLRLHFKWRDNTAYGYILKWLDA
jgi:hypothetical protein